MNYTTGTQRDNKRMDDIFNSYRAQQEAKKDFLPTITEYSHFLGLAEAKFKITRDKARDRFGRFTHGQWKELLNIW